LLALPALSLEGCTLRIVLQKSEPQLPPFQSLRASLQKPQGCHAERFFNSAFRSQPSSLFLALPALSLEGSREGFTLLQERKGYPLFLQSLPHSLRKTPGMAPRAFFKFRDVQTCRRFDVQTIPKSFIRNTYKKKGEGYPVG